MRALYIGPVFRYRSPSVRPVPVRGCSCPSRPGRRSRPPGATSSRHLHRRAEPTEHRDRTRVGDGRGLHARRPRTGRRPRGAATANPIPNRWSPRSVRQPPPGTPQPSDDAGVSVDEGNVAETPNHAPTRRAGRSPSRGTLPRPRSVSRLERGRPGVPARRDLVDDAVGARRLRSTVPASTAEPDAGIADGFAQLVPVRPDLAPDTHPVPSRPGSASSGRVAADLGDHDRARLSRGGGRQEGRGT